jgi:hypothetical protein
VPGSEASGGEGLPGGATTALPSAVPPTPGRAGTRAACTTGAASAIAELACELAAGVGPMTGTVTVAAAQVASERPLPRAVDLSTRLAVALAGALDGRARAVAGALSLEQARGAAATSSSLVFVTAELVGGRLRVSAATYLLGSDRTHPAAVTAALHAEASRPLDGEVGSYLARVPLLVTRVERAAAGNDIYALACGDLAGKGDAEILAVGRRKLQVGRAGDGRFSVRAEAAWTSLSPVAPSPLREPIGAAALLPGGRVVVGLSDRADGVALSTSLSPLGKLDAPLPWEYVGCLTRSGIALGSPHPCTGGPEHRVDVGDAAGIDAFASGAFVDDGGKVTHVVAWRTAGTREVTLRDDAGHGASAAVAGSALAIADLDLDGRPELIASVETDNPEEDAIVVSTWARDGTVTERLRVPVKDGVHALTACPVKDASMAPIVAATGGGLWVVH